MSFDLFSREESALAGTSPLLDALHPTERSAFKTFIDNRNMVQKVITSQKLESTDAEEEIIGKTEQAIESIANQITELLSGREYPLVASSYKQALELGKFRFFLRKVEDESKPNQVNQIYAVDLKPFAYEIPDGYFKGQLRVARTMFDNVNIACLSSNEMIFLILRAWKQAKKINAALFPLLELENENYLKLVTDDVCAQRTAPFQVVVRFLREYEERQSSRISELLLGSTPLLNSEKLQDVYAQLLKCCLIMAVNGYKFVTYEPDVNELTEFASTRNLHFSEDYYLDHFVENSAIEQLQLLMGENEYEIFCDSLEDDTCIYIEQPGIEFCGQLIEHGAAQIKSQKERQFCCAEYIETQFFAQAGEFDDEEVECKAIDYSIDYADINAKIDVVRKQMVSRLQGFNRQIEKFNSIAANSERYTQLNDYEFCLPEYFRDAYKGKPASHDKGSAVEKPFPYFESIYSKKTKQ